MPTYDFKCNKCGIIREVFVNLSEQFNPVCCEHTMERVWSAPGVQFKGTGFYSTDNK